MKESSPTPWLQETPQNAAHAFVMISHQSQDHSAG